MSRYTEIAADLTMDQRRILAEINQTAEKVIPMAELPALLGLELFRVGRAIHGLRDNRLVGETRDTAREISLTVTGQRVCAELTRGASA